MIHGAARSGALACLLALAWSPPAAALVQYQRLEQMHHTSWSARDGLVGEALALTQTTDGFLWIGTNNGLYRFDGVQFERHQPERGQLPAIAISTLAPAPSGGLWVGYVSGGVSLLGADGTITTYAAADSLPIGLVRSIVVDHDGTAWVAAVGGLAYLDADRWHKVRTDWNYPGKSAWTLFVERDGTLWVGVASPDRLAYLPRGSKRFVDIGIDHSALGFSQLDDSTIVYSHQTEETVHFLRRIPGGATEFQVIDGIPSLAIAIDREGGFWISGYDVTRRRLSPDPAGGGVKIAAGPVERVQRAEEEGTPLSRGVLVDGEGTVWTITERGLDRFRRRSLTWIRDTMVQFNGTVVADQNRDVWLMTRQAPTVRRLRDNKILRGTPDRVDFGTLDNEGAIWLSTPTELLRWKDDRLSPIPPPQQVVDRHLRFTVIASAVDHSGRFWASVGGSGVFYRKDQSWTFVSVLPGRPDWAATAVQPDTDDRVWLAYRDEVAAVQNGNVRIFSKAQGLDVGPLQSLRTHGRQVWVGGELGLALLHGEQFHTVRVADGVDFSSVSGIVPTADGIWLTAGMGIVHIPGTEVAQLVDNPAHPVRYEVFDLESDLPEALSIYVGYNRAIEGRDGVLWFLTKRGIAQIDPRRVVHSPAAPPVVLRRVTADDRIYQLHEPLLLPPLTRTLHIEYTAPSLAIPGRVRFRHRLDGWDNQWHDAGPRREVFYTDLRPGQYTLRVAASNSNGVWNETGAAFPFTVAPAWFQTAWFQILTFLAIIGLIMLAYRNRVRQVAAALSARFDERLAERTRIARDLHDTLLQTVQASRIVAQQALNAGDPDRLRRGMEGLIDSLGQAVKEGRGAVQTLRDSAAASHDLAEAFGRVAASPDRPAELTVSVAVHGTVRELHPMVQDEIYRIGYEAIRNVFAHSGASQLDITLDYGQDLSLCIDDNGCGIDSTLADGGKPGHFGLHGMRERAQTIEGTITINGGNKGTTMLLVVPGRRAFGGR